MQLVVVREIMQIGYVYNINYCKNCRHSDIAGCGMLFCSTTVTTNSDAKCLFLTLPFLLLSFALLILPVINSGLSLEA